MSISNWKCPQCRRINSDTSLNCNCGYDRPHALNRLKEGCKICGDKIKKPTDLYCSQCKKEVLAKMKKETDYFQPSINARLSPRHEYLDRENFGTKAVQHDPIEDKYDEESDP